jgi:hypothetical protein
MTTDNKSLCATCSEQKPDNKWRPTPIEEWRKVVLSRVYKYENNDSDPRYSIFSNVAYNLQYLEYLHKCLKEQFLTSVIRSQLTKTFTLTSSQIIECLLYIKLIDMKVNQSEIWEFSRALKIAEEKKADGLDSYMSARYQACALNYNYYLKLLFGEKKGLDNNLALSLQFAELSFNQVQIAKNNEKLIPKEIKGYIADFDDSLPQDELKSDRFAYRLLFTKVVAKRAGQADRVIEFIDPDSALAKSISKEYYVIKKEKSKLYLARQVLSALAKKGINLSIPEHTILWKKYDAKNSSKGFGTSVGNSWFWYNDWIEFLTKELAS